MTAKNDGFSMGWFDEDYWVTADQIPDTYDGTRIWVVMIEGGFFPGEHPLTIRHMPLTLAARSEPGMFGRQQHVYVCEKRCPTCKRAYES